MDDLGFDYYEDMKFNNSTLDDFFEEDDFDLNDFGVDPIIDKNNNARQLDANEPNFFKKAVKFLANTVVFIGAVIGSFVRAIVFGDSFTRELEISKQNFDKAGKVNEKNKENKKFNKTQNDEVENEQEDIKEETKEKMSEKKRDEIADKLQNMFKNLEAENYSIFKELGIDAELHKVDSIVDANGKLIKNPSINVTFFDKFRNPKMNFSINGDSLNDFTNSASQIMQTQPFVHNDILTSIKGKEFTPHIEQEALVNAAIKSSMIQAVITIASRKDMMSKNTYGDMISHIKLGEYTDKKGNIRNNELRLYASSCKNINNEYENKITFRYKGRDIATIDTEDLLGISNKESGYLLSKVDEISKIMYQMMRKDDLNYIKEYTKNHNINLDNLEELKQEKVDVVTEEIIKEKHKIKEEYEKSQNKTEEQNQDEEEIESEEQIDGEFSTEDIMGESGTNQLNEEDFTQENQDSEEIPNIDIEIEEDEINEENINLNDFSEEIENIEDELNKEETIENISIPSEEEYEDVGLDFYEDEEDLDL